MGQKLTVFVSAGNTQADALVLNSEVSILEVPSSLMTGLMLEACNEISVHAMHSGC